VVDALQTVDKHAVACPPTDTGQTSSFRPHDRGRREEAGRNKAVKVTDWYFSAEVDLGSVILKQYYLGCLACVLSRRG
jgi:hypothetical protein